MLLVLWLFLSVAGFAGSCCGSSSSLVPVLTNYENWQLSLTQSFSKTYARESNGIIDLQPRRRKVWLSSVSAVTLLGSSRRWQLGGGFTWQTGEIDSNASASHGGDVVTHVSYEALPEYEYSVWQPKVYLSAVLNWPTGNSIYQSKQDESIDVVGVGQWGTGALLTLSKTWYPVMVFSQARFLRLHPQRFATGSAEGFWENSYYLKVSRQMRLWSLATFLSLQWVDTGQRSFRASDSQRFNSAESRSVLPSLGVTKNWQDWSVQIRVGDQRVQSVSKNVLLNQTYSLSISLRDL